MRMAYLFVALRRTSTQNTSPLPSPKAWTRPILLAIASALLLGLAGCAGSGPKVAQTRRALDPAGFPQAVSGPGFTVSAVAYEPPDDGFDYQGAGFSPVLIVLKSTGGEQPQLIVEDVRAVTQDGQYLPYTPAEAARLAAHDLAFAEKTKTALKDGFVGAVIGGGLGALAGLATGKGPSAVWMGAAVGAAAGGTYGAVSSLPHSRSDLARAVAADLEAQAWREDPLAPGTTRAGYLYLPSRPKVTSLGLLVRGSQGGDVWVNLPIVSPKEYMRTEAHGAGRAAGSPYGWSELPRPKPAPAPAVANSPDRTPQNGAQPAQNSGSNPGPNAQAASARVDQPAQAEAASPGGADMAQNDGSGDGQAAAATSSDQDDEGGVTVAEDERADDQSLDEADESPNQSARKAPQRVSQERGGKAPAKAGRTTPRQGTPPRQTPASPEGVTI